MQYQIPNRMQKSTLSATPQTRTQDAKTNASALEQHFTQAKLGLILFLLLLQLTACGGGDDNNTVNTPSIPAVPTQPTTPDTLCSPTNDSVNWPALMAEDCPLLSQYALFSDPLVPTQAPRTPGFGYQLATELFSNYASKYRFIFLPNGEKIHFQAQSSFDLPTGSVLVKTFALPLDTSLQGPNNEVLVETRLLIHRENGWVGLTYQWQDGHAKLLTTGANVRHSLVNQGETIVVDYPIPSRVECKICHQSIENNVSKIIPIGLKAHLLNRDINVQQQTVNQLSYWQQTERINALPALEQITKTFAINDESASLTVRAKGYLDINCSHCHNPSGFASISGLRLGFNVDHRSYQYGICKQPPGWDGGEKGLSYDIVPGNAEHSILLYRQTLSSAKDRMPPLGRTITHQEGVSLIRRWLDELPPSLGDCN